MKTQTTTDKQEPNGFMKFLNAPFGRFLLIGTITIFLLPPLARVIFLIQERKDRAETIKEEIRSEWGSDFMYKGLVLRIPLKNSKQHLFYFPESENTTLHVNASTKKRGIYHFPVFQSNNHTSAVFIPNLNNPNLDLSKVQIGLLALTKTRISNMGKIEVNGKGLDVEQETTAESSPDKLFYATAPFTIDKSTTQINVNTTYTINGSGKIILKGFAKKSAYQMTSNWENPSFSGTSLPNPDSFQIKKGFKSAWSMMNIAQNSKVGINQSKPYGNLSEASVDFLESVDQYQLNERTVKYAILVILLTFTVFYLIELIGKMVIHPLHYLMVGLSLILFYVILLSFSEQFGFARSYLAASIGILSLLSWYAYSVLRSLKFAFTILAAISILYGFLYVIVNLETYALIVGSLGLFAVLSAIMSFTRRLKM
ncbi:cell envelope integrity protein CreD [Fluviicola chungangensis]|uniref:Cell envelope integrity protein CreD n=1 Tax=Fluviicola chungangensis TaxID=2597671 RepID=A0A556MYL4_9FLAO|nr:cell envelope integrity protein CreD [Fluviicola chungangensis]TSJ45010.1 cell envelope integrity protein CreD [Fluviicola chungangensis]